MKKDVAEAWVKDLRKSGAKQARSVLFNGEGYCCLGRLCVALGLDFRKEYDNANRQNYFYVNGTTKATTLPDKAMDEAGMRTRSGEFVMKCHGYNIYNESYESLTGLNDDGLTFAQIADIIEWIWEDL